MGNPWPQELWQKYEVVTSPSAVSAYLTCPRKWWFDKVKKLPEIQNQGKFVFGTTLHEVCERWLSADDLGRVRNDNFEWGHPLYGQTPGDEVDLYPDGWDKDISKAEAALIRVQVKKAIDQGILRRMPNREVEKTMIREITPESCMIGKLDVVSPQGVEDHKTTGSKRWISTPDDLATDEKMLCYAYEWTFYHPDDQEIPLRLNYFSKKAEDPFVRAVETTVDADAVEAWWNSVIVLAADEMVAIKQSNVDVVHWSKIEKPRVKGACKKYGGCAYASVCGLSETPGAYTKRINKINNKPAKPARDKSMANIFDRKRNQTPKSEKAAPLPEPTVTPPKAKKSTVSKDAKSKRGRKPAKAEAAVVAETVDASNIPPWANPKCRACGGKGINKKGNPCRACDTVAKKKELPSSADFEFGINDDGVFWWEGTDESGEVEMISEPKVTQPKPRKGKPEPAPEPVELDAAEGEEDEYEDAEPEPEAEEAIVVKATAEFDKAMEEPQPGHIYRPDETPGLPSLYINCVPQNAEYVPFADVFMAEAAELAEASGKDSFYDLDPFKRKDALCGQAAVIATGLAGKIIVAVGLNGMDQKALLEAMRPFCGEIVTGTF